MVDLDAVALTTVEALFDDLRDRAVLKWFFDHRGEENLIGYFHDGDELRGIPLEVQGQIKAKWQTIVASALRSAESQGAE